MNYFNFILAVVFLASITAYAKDVNDENAYFSSQGGIVQKPYKGKYVVIINNQSLINSKDFFSEGNSIEDIFNFPVRVLGKNEKVADAGVIVQITESKAAPSLLIAPEANWASVNVTALATDKPSAEVLKSRVQKEIMRAYLYAAGVANSEVQPCLMRPIRRAKDLDKYSVMQPGPSAVAPVINTASQLGIFERTIMTYKEACEEGWAAAPTNEIQKAIWDQVRATPKNPMKIEFDPKKGR